MKIVNIFFLYDHKDKVFTVKDSNIGLILVSHPGPSLNQTLLAQPCIISRVFALIMVKKKSISLRIINELLPRLQWDIR